jgi:hypothetical protein
MGESDVVGRLTDKISIRHLNLQIDGMPMAWAQILFGEKLIDLDRQPKKSVTPFKPKFVS